MKIELKKLKIVEALSEETLCFTADIYVDGIKTAYASNRGCGGSTDYHAYSPELRPLLAKAEAFCETLPEKDFGGSFKLKMNLEHFIDELVYKEDEKKQTLKFEKKLQKNMEKGLCYGTKEKYAIWYWKGATLRNILSTPSGEAVVKQTIKKLQQEGKIILNTNIPELLATV